jgi:hypothetical protein
MKQKLRKRKQFYFARLKMKRKYLNVVVVVVAVENRGKNTGKQEEKKGGRGMVAQTDSGPNKQKMAK